MNVSATLPPRQLTSYILQKPGGVSALILAVSVGFRQHVTDRYQQ